MAELFANSGDPDQVPHSAASYLGLHCLPLTVLGLTTLQPLWVILCCLPEKRRRGIVEEMKAKDRGERGK